MDDRTVLLTGAATPMAVAVTRAFLEAGASVVVGDRDGDDLAALTDSIDEGRDRLTTVRTDPRDEYDLERLAETASRAGARSGIDVVVPGAAIAHGDPDDQRLAGASYAAFEDHWRVNVRGVFATVGEALAHLTDDARILIPIDGIALRPPDGNGAYGVSRSGTVAVARAFGAELDVPVGMLEVGTASVTAGGSAGSSGGASGGASWHRRTGTNVDPGAEPFDPSDLAAMFVWAATEARDDELDSTIVDPERVLDRVEVG